MRVRKLVWLGRVCLLASGFFAFAAGGASHAAEIGISWPGKSASILVLQLSFPLRLNNRHSFCTRSVQIRLGETHQTAVHEMGWCTPTYT